jgi:hypothetical protein
LIPEQALGAWMRVKTPEKGEEGDDSRVVNFFLRNKEDLFFRLNLN